MGCDDDEDQGVKMKLFCNSSEEKEDGMDAATTAAKSASIKRRRRQEYIMKAQLFNRLHRLISKAITCDGLRRKR